MTGIAAEDSAERRTVQLDRDEAMRLLAGTQVGRVVFTRDALPAIRPVNHLVDEDGSVVLRTRVAARFTCAIRGNSPVVVAYQADDIDTTRRLGWSVVVTGFARPVTDPDRLARYERLLHSWVDMVMDTVIVIEPEIVTGIRLVEKQS
ncbi:pyridoxamine 5'-phosphate oxidase family protein [Nocardia blacklockiae]|uniref:pyridoxamine 5'-phosphate oxidase family protein n=1 Tax=Nocardia blacklockiae TaxID=480036 RepID=UPI001894C4D9|nr:pyridoxamine 5'-phosphate oxidase family protein [Nocardia blacklockiae]MBF6176634.1 pyridoxamine 5'-phosphate oxidase family protein [Nocardia blacklockiae]